LGIKENDQFGKLARNRLSTVYMPGNKITMLPQEILGEFTLVAGNNVPAMSLYMDISDNFQVTNTFTRLELVTVVANLRHHNIEPLFNSETLAQGLSDFAYAEELTLLFHLAEKLVINRNQKLNIPNQEFNFSVDWSVATAFGQGEISISARPRGSPLDTLVAELMIAANTFWAKTLRDSDFAAFYRVQTSGKVRLSTTANKHEGLGVYCYAWMTSPLRRYCDLLNQWQLVALLRDESPPFKNNDTELFAAMRDFELCYASYSEFQREMEKYWCLRYILQSGQRVYPATWLRDNLVSLCDLPLILTVNGLTSSISDKFPDQAAAIIHINIDEIDLFLPQVTASLIN